MSELYAYGTGKTRPLASFQKYLVSLLILP